MFCHSERSEESFHFAHIRISGGGETPPFSISNFPFSIKKACFQQAFYGALVFPVFQYVPRLAVEDLADFVKR